MQKFMRFNRHNSALVCAEVPLISNQEAWLNIALIKQYYDNMSPQESEKLVFSLLRKLGLESVAYKRNPALSDEERFFIMLLRAAMVKDAVILIDRPFKIIPHLKKEQLTTDGYIKLALKLLLKR